jgi:hypothetical protein
MVFHFAHLNCRLSVISDVHYNRVRYNEVLLYKYYDFGHYPSSCLYLETPSCLFFKTQRFGDWILSPSSGKTNSIGPNR